MLFPNNSTAPNSYFDELYHSIYNIDGSDNYQAILAYPIMKSLRDFVILSINDDNFIKNMIYEMFENYFDCDGDYLIMPAEYRPPSRLIEYVKFNCLIKQLINNNRCF